MTAGLRLIMTALPVAFAIGALAAPLAAQDNTQAAAPPPANGVIGPSELRDFSLTGPVTRTPAPPAATPAPPQAEPPAARTQPATTVPSPTGSRAVAPPRAQDRPASRPSQPAVSAPPPTAGVPSSSVTLSLPSADSGAAGTPGDSSSGLGSQPGLVPAEPPASASIAVDSGPLLWPWLLAALAAALGIFYYAFRQRSRPALAAAGPAPFAAPLPDKRPAAPTPPAPRPAGDSGAALAFEPALSPAPASPPPAPVSSKIPGMIVSTRLRPQIEVQFVPERMIVDEQEVTIQFAAVILNSGSATARDVLVEAMMFNAGDTLDEEIGAFFAHPRARGDRIPEIFPLKTVTLRNAVVLPYGQIRVFEVDGRQLFVPAVAFNALYRWNGKDSQTSESYIVGIDAQADRMAPFRMDGQPRQFRKLAARAHTARLRK